MSQSLSSVILHTVFSTKGRRPWLQDRLVRQALHRYLGGILLERNCPPLIVGGVEDHVHLLSEFSRTGSIADLVKEVKRGSSAWLKTQGPSYADFAWQNGYGVFSLGFSQIDAARRYIEDQETHHHQTSFQEEYRLLLEKYGARYDERHVWD